MSDAIWLICPTGLNSINVNSKREDTTDGWVTAGLCWRWVILVLPKVLCRKMYPNMSVMYMFVSIFLRHFLTYVGGRHRFRAQASRLLSLETQATLRRPVPHIYRPVAG
jgi:hypothetical protein